MSNQESKTPRTCWYTTRDVDVVAECLHSMSPHIGTLSDCEDRQEFLEGARDVLQALFPLTERERLEEALKRESLAHLAFEDKLHSHLTAIRDVLHEIGIVNAEEVESSVDEIVPAIRTFGAERKRMLDVIEALMVGAPLDDGSRSSALALLREHDRLQRPKRT